jgi:hypothetical protein
MENDKPVYPIHITLLGTVAEMVCVDYFPDKE